MAAKTNKLLLNLSRRATLRGGFLLSDSSKYQSNSKEIRTETSYLLRQENVARRHRLPFLLGR